MDIGLTEIFGECLVGLLLLLIFDYLIKFSGLKKYLQNKSPLFKSFRLSKLSKSFPTAIFSVLVIVTYGLGTLFHVLTYSLARNTEFEFQKYTKAIIIGNLFSHEIERRFDVLFEECDEGFCYKKTNLGSDLLTISYVKEMLKNRYKDEASGCKKIGEEITNFLHQDTVEWNTKTRQYANFLYYQAKNWAFHQETYFQELRTIELRTSFSRSMFYVLLLWIIVILTKFILGKVKRMIYLSKDHKNRGPDLFLFLIILFLLFLSGYAQRKSDIEFNKRVFGYFASEHRAVSIQPAD